MRSHTPMAALAVVFRRDAAKTGLQNSSMLGKSASAQTSGAEGNAIPHSRTGPPAVAAVAA